MRAEYEASGPEDVQRVVSALSTEAAEMLRAPRVPRAALEMLRDDVACLQYALSATRLQLSGAELGTLGPLVWALEETRAIASMIDSGRGGP